MTVALDRPTIYQTHEAPAQAPRDARRGRALVLVAILLLAVNLRMAVTSVGALLPEVTDALRLSAGAAGVITMLPALIFAAFGALTPRLAARTGTTRLLLAALGLLTAGQAARVLTSSAAAFLIASAAAMAGIAVGNVLLPALVKRYFPDRVGQITGLYTMVLIGGSALGAAASVPVADGLGSWRYGLGVWALVGAVAIGPWLAFRAVDGAWPAPAGEAPAGEPVRPARTRVGWALAIYFGAQSLSGYAIVGWLAQLYRDAGYSPQVAGLLLAGVMVVGLPMALLMPSLAARRPDQRGLVAVLAAAMMAAYLGLALAPQAGALLWTLLLAVGQGAFPLVLAMIGLRARTPAGTVALSAFAQSTGYLMAALGPLGVGLLYDLTGGWLARWARSSRSW